MKQDTFQKLEPGKYYHIYNRGNNKETIFKEPQNYDYFLSRWIKYIEPIAKTLCYNLLPDHFHFFIRVEKINNDLQNDSASQAFSNLFNAYAKAINKKYHRTGSLFQERFRRKEITSDVYFTKIVGYILTNSIKHGYSEDVSAYPYSAYNSLLSDKPTRFLRDEVFSWFNGKESFVNYIESYQQDIIDLKFILENEDDD
ncbi:MAG: hypothetical protein ABIN36_12850 [Ferruginibacter sp.]